MDTIVHIVLKHACFGPAIDPAITCTMSTIELLRVQVKADVAFSDVDKLLQEATQQHSVQQDLITMHYGWHVEDATMLTMFFREYSNFIKTCIPAL